MEDNQDDFKVALNKVFIKLDNQDSVLNAINKKFDEMTGAKRVLIGLYGFIVVVIGFLASWLGVHHK
jgi:hypothetical protein